MSLLFFDPLHLHRTEAVEKEMMLRTRAMRERDETKSVLRYYRFVLLRVRMPDNYIIQGEDHSPHTGSY